MTHNKHYFAMLSAWLCLFWAHFPSQRISGQPDLGRIKPLMLQCSHQEIASILYRFLFEPPPQPTPTYLAHTNGSNKPRANNLAENIKYLQCSQLLMNANVLVELESVRGVLRVNCAQRASVCMHEWSTAQTKTTPCDHGGVDVKSSTACKATSIKISR